MMLAMVVGLLALFAEPEIRRPLLGKRCGRIIIEGNTDTPDRIPLELLRLRPGEKFTFAKIQAARQRLWDCAAFWKCEWLGIGPVVEILPDELDSEFWDVRVRIIERPENWFLFWLNDAFESTIWAIVFLCPAPLIGVIESFNDRALRKERGEP